MKTKLLGLIAACALLGSTVAANASSYIVTLEQVGSNVVATGSGSIDTTDLTFIGSGVNQRVIQPAFAFIAVGPWAEPSADTYKGVVGPSSFGGGGTTLPSSGTGDFVGVCGAE